MHNRVQINPKPDICALLCPLHRRAEVCPTHSSSTLLKTRERVVLRLSRLAIFVNSETSCITSFPNSLFPDNHLQLGSGLVYLDSIAGATREA